MAAVEIPSKHVSSSNRAYALDALRGIAILAMLLAGQIYSNHPLPAWMYHAQEPPPTFEFSDTVYGISWVDLVFPFFLFSMGAAFPLAFSRRMDEGAKPWQLSLFIAERGILLGFFALYVEAIRPHVLQNHPTRGTYWLALLAFALLFPLLTRLPREWSLWTKAGIRAIGWVGTILFLALAQNPDAEGFKIRLSDVLITTALGLALFVPLLSDYLLGFLGIVMSWFSGASDRAMTWLARIVALALIYWLVLLALSSGGSGFIKQGRSDIIIVVLTNMAVFGAAIWMVTRKQWLPRLGVLGIVMAMRLSNRPVVMEGWVHNLWMWSPLPWMYQLYYLQYLNIVIPGTIAGDLILQWTRAPKSENPASADGTRWPAWRLITLCILMFLFVLVSLIGLKARWLLPTTLTIFAMGGLGCWLVNHPRNETETLYRKLFLWGIYWLVLGYFFEPYEGGIKKDHPTMSYYFVTSGLANCMLIGLSIIVDVFRRKRWLQFLIDNGQNPMIAYAGINNLIIPVLALIGLDKWMEPCITTAWLGFWRGAFITLLVGIVVSLLTRRKIFWRT